MCRRQRDCQALKPARGVLTRRGLKPPAKTIICALDAHKKLCYGIGVVKGVFDDSSL